MYIHTYTCKQAANYVNILNYGGMCGVCRCLYAAQATIKGPPRSASFIAECLQVAGSPDWISINAAFLIKTIQKPLPYLYYIRNL